MERESDAVRVGGVGTGRIFQWAHLDAYPRLWRKARLTALHDADPARAEEARAKFAAKLEAYAAGHPEAADAVAENLTELRCFDSLDGLLDCVDVIDICTHSRDRMAIAMAALEKGVHSMAEKPMARTWIEADRAARAFAERPDVLFQLNDDNVFDPKYHLLRDLVSGRELGRPQSMWLVRASALGATTVLKSQASAIDNGGGCLMDYGSHGLAGSWYVLGTHLRPIRVEAVSIRRRHPDRVLEGDPCRIEVEDDAHVKVLLEDPGSGSWVTVFLEASWSGGEIGLMPDADEIERRRLMRIECDEGVIDATEPFAATVRRWDGTETRHELEEYEGETVSFHEEIETMMDCVRTATAPAIGIEFGADVIAMCQAGYLSAIRGRAVTLEEFKDHCRGYVARHGDNERAELALLGDLLRPYRDGV